jgi:glycoprotein 6-alpha-L-fucosyltransferase
VQIIENIFLSNVGNADTFYSLIVGLGKDHEILRRRIENGAKELWFFLQSELKKLKNLEGKELQRHADEFLSDLGHHER